MAETHPLDDQTTHVSKDSEQGVALSCKTEATAGYSSLRFQLLAERIARKLPEIPFDKRC